MDDGESSNTGIWKRFIHKLPFGENEDVTEEEIISMVKEGHEQGVLMENEAEMIHNIFEFADKEAKDIMTHRKNIVALDGNSALTQALDYIIENSYSRFPVYEENIDNIIGVVHIKEALANSRRQELMNTPIKEIPGLVREVDYIPETRNVNALFQKMQSAQTHMVIVVDEYGQTAGLVAMEDILEEIVGNIFDEHDVEHHFITETEDGSFLMSGMTPLDEVGDVLNLDFDDAAYDTLNGFLISQIDRIPSEDEKVCITYEGYSFEVLSVEDKIIQSVKVNRFSQNQQCLSEDESIVESVLSSSKKNDKIS
ncbi:MAG: hemolysin family protein [Lachnospiraceae bacterium]|nr:hemolysin family protein [Lachnospiraceae bacterium]